MIGLACRFPDAGDPPELLDLVLTGRRAFRRVPPSRLDLAGYHGTGPGRQVSPDVPDVPEVPGAAATAGQDRAAVLEGWQFDRAAFGVSWPAYLAADHAYWLALETVARALAGAGFPGGTGLPADRTGLIIGTGPAGGTGGSGGSGSGPGGVAGGLCAHFGFGGASLALGDGGASSLLAVAAGCAAVAAGEVDVAVAGGVDLSLRPLGLARAGPACGEVRIYDREPTGFLPGEGCGMVVLMRTREARARGLPVYAEIAGWASSPAGLLPAMREACDRAGADPADMQLIEGDGDSTAVGDEAEIAALTRLRAGARGTAALGSIKANIGHAGAAAGAAGLIKAVLAASTGVIPPATGAGSPHPALLGGASVRLPGSAEHWPEGTRLAGVSASSPGGLSAHLVLRHEPGRAARPGRGLLTMPPRLLPGRCRAPRAETASLPAASLSAASRRAAFRPAAGVPRARRRPRRHPPPRRGRWRS